MTLKEERQLNKQRNKTDIRMAILKIQNEIMSELYDNCQQIIDDFRDGKYECILSCEFGLAKSYLFDDCGALWGHSDKFNERIKNEVENMFPDIDIKKTNVSYDNGLGHRPYARITITFND